jgi:hypothetical protein
MKILAITQYANKVIFAASLLFLVACQTTAPGSEPEAAALPETTTDSTEASVTETPAGTEEAAVEDSGVQACECPVAETVTCPQVVLQPVPNNQEKNFSVGDKLVLGRVERVLLLPKKLPLKAKVDTGAKTSSLNAIDLTEFERDGKDWVRFAMLNPETDKKIFFERAVVRKTRIKQLDSDLQHRPTVKMTIMLGTMKEQVEFTLANRTGYLYQVLIGRNVLRDRFIVDVSQTFLTEATE